MELTNVERAKNLLEVKLEHYIQELHSADAEQWLDPRNRDQWLDAFGYWLLNTRKLEGRQASNE